ncbi:MAG: hypothetical protein C0467_30730 [Planctomycetaceae bacterium]|nr:hypothetical protein [Planctomycetaceae bacterium]
MIEADNADKVKALIAAMEDEVGILEVISPLEGFGKDAAPALPQLKKLKTSSKDVIRNASIKAVERIE